MQVKMVKWINQFCHSRFDSRRIFTLKIFNDIDMAAQNNHDIQHAFIDKKLLCSNGRLIGVLELQSGWSVKPGNVTGTGERVFVVKKIPDIEIVREVVRHPNVAMPNEGTFNRKGRRTGSAPPRPYPNHTFPRDFTRP